MNIGILAVDTKMYAIDRLLEEGRNRGHQIEVINPLYCYMNITSKKPQVYHKQKALNDFDCVIPRIREHFTFYGTAVLRQFEMMGVSTLNSSLAVGRALDQLRMLQILSKRGVSIPKSGFAHSTRKTSDFIRLLGGAPLVIKLIDGNRGSGTVLAETTQAAKSVMDAFRNLNAYFLVQEYIEEAKGVDIRCLVLGDRVISTIARRSRKLHEDENLLSGGDPEHIVIEPEVKQMAVSAVKNLNLEFAGVDLLLSNQGPMIIDVQPTPGIQTMEKITETNLAVEVIKFIENKMKRKKDEP